VVEGVRENGDGIAVDRRKGLAEADETGGEDVVTLVWSGGRDGAWIDTGRPPGVRALAIEGPGVRVSRAPVGVAVLRRLGSSRMGVGDFEVEYIESTDEPATWEVSEGSNVDDNVLSPEGVSKAAAYSSARIGMEWWTYRFTQFTQYIPNDLAQQSPNPAFRPIGGYTNDIWSK
jgi:hypothetical protein